MPKEFLLPELAESVVEGEIIKWLVGEGEEVQEDQPLVEVMTDKVTVELPSPFSGRIEKHLMGEGDIAAVGQPIALYEPAGGEAGQAVAASGGAAATAPESSGGPVESVAESGSAEPEDDGDKLSLFRPSGSVDDGPAVQVRRKGTGSWAPTPAPAAARPEAPAPANGPAAVKGPYGRVLAVPAARKLARELGVDIETVPGSGPNGRIRVDDVRGFAERGPGRAPAAAPAPASHEELEERIPVRGLRRAISQQMVASHLNSVRTLHVDEADVSELVALRSRLKPLAEKQGARLSYLPFIMKAVVAALKEFPMINASLDEERGEIVRKHYYNLGLAVATDNGLVVPVIHDVDSKGLSELAGEINEKAARARDGKLQPDDVRGGTFSITNIGSLGGLFSFPIINVPEAAILGVHSIKKRPVVLEDDSIVARHMLYLSLSFDHRLIDGAEAALFTSRVIEIIETPESLML